MRYAVLVLYIEISTNPKYKFDTISSDGVQYNSNTGEYVNNGNANVIIEGNTSFKYFAYNSGTNLVTFTLHSNKQGSAVYGLKVVNQWFTDIEKIKDIKSLKLEKEEISNFMKKETFGHYLNDVKLDNNKLILTYDYYIGKDISLMFANELFALIDDLEMIEFNTSFSKFIKNVNDPITYEHTEYELDESIPLTYSRDNFKDTSLNLSLEELRKYLGK